MPLINTPERPLKKTPTFKRLWHMALQLWYHRQIIRRYKARPIKYKKAYHTMVAALKTSRSKYHHLDALRRATKEADDMALDRAQRDIARYNHYLHRLDTLAQYHREFIIKIARDSTHQATPELMNKAIDHIRNEPKA